jgi:hypothetical protein
MCVDSAARVSQGESSMRSRPLGVSLADHWLTARFLSIGHLT